MAKTVKLKFVVVDFDHEAFVGRPSVQLQVTDADGAEQKVWMTEGDTFEIEAPHRSAWRGVLKGKL